MSSAEYKTSAATAIKQQSFEAVVDLWCVVYQAIARRNRLHYPVNYIDLNSGPGEDENGKIGSPIIFQKIAKRHGVSYRAILYEKDATCAEMLRVNCLKHGLDPHDFEIRNKSNEYVLDDLTPTRNKSNRYGIIYSDVSNAPAIPLDLLANLNQKFSHLDVLINLAFSSYKRTCNQEDYIPLYKALPYIKRYWKVRRPATEPAEIAKFQWSLIFGLNWGKYPNQTKYGFYDFESPMGQHYWKTITHTKSELTKNEQLSLWGESYG